MKKRVVLAFVAMLTLAGVSPVLADEYGAFPDNAGGNSGRCQEVGDENADDNDDNGLSIADGATEVIQALAQDDECDNSGGRRP